MTAAGLVASAKRLAADSLRTRVVGALRYLLHPERGSAWGGPFNGQVARQALFARIVAETAPRAIVETGTYLGTTTAFMAEMSLPVFTIEADAMNYGFARARFRRNPYVRVFYGD